MDERWDKVIAEFPGAHFLQTYEWSKIKEKIGWTPVYFTWQKNGDTYRMSPWQPDQENIFAVAMVLERSTIYRNFHIPIKVMYIPKGPLLEWENIPLRDQVLHDLINFTKNRGGIFVKIDPDVLEGKGIQGISDFPLEEGQQLINHLQERGWILSQDQIQFKNSFILDLKLDETHLLSNMKQKTRYNIRLAGKHGVNIRVGDLVDLDLLYDLYAETSIRDGFIIREKGYYQSVWSRFIQSGIAEPLIAEVDNSPVAGVIIFRFGNKAWYVYGMSRDIHREKMPGYLLQWVAIQRAKRLGLKFYDFWGAPDEFLESDRMWGVYKFKEGLGGEVIRTIGAWDYPVHKNLYILYSSFLPKILHLIRMRRNKKTKVSYQHEKYPSNPIF